MSHPLEPTTAKDPFNKRHGVGVVIKEPGKVNSRGIFTRTAGICARSQGELKFDEILKALVGVCLETIRCEWAVIHPDERGLCR